jgi:hypothetical protein
LQQVQNLLQVVINNKMRIISEKEYLLKNYLHLVGGHQRLAYWEYFRNRKDVYLKMYKKQFIDPQIKRGIYSEESLNDFLNLTREEAEDTLIQEIKNLRGDKVYWNHCPECHNLARTQFARQCPSCGLKWHDAFKGKFLVKDKFYLKSRNCFYLKGIINEGHIKIGWHISLVEFNLNYKPEIIAIDFSDSMSSPEDCFVCLGIKIKSDSELAIFTRMNIVERIIDIET